MSTQVASKMTSKYQITVPAPIRDVLSLDKGDALVFTIEDGGAVTVRKGVPFDRTFIDALDAQLTEWDTDEDDEAYRAL